jgi:hypothetical protein
MSSADMHAPGDVLASGCRRDVVRAANESGKPVSYWWSRLMGRVLLLMVEADDIVTMISGFSDRSALKRSSKMAKGGRKGAGSGIGRKEVEKSKRRKWEQAIFI